ncbi:MAG: ATP-binding cassette domain-containing protein [Nanoarchaeota archaeon]|nr:ATP-binding cassette domain-containing protein [Nanoarchaeota archaeon]
MSVIIVKDLKKHFKSVKAVDGISFNIGEGQIFGLLGPNGAGKTTSIKILATLLKPSSGNVTVCGYDVNLNSSKVRSSIGIVFQEPSLDVELTAFENLILHARLYNVPRSETMSRISDVLELVDLSDKRNIQVKNFSGGMKRRLEIARGLIHHPRVLFLDEPTLGLDPQTRSKIWDYILKLKKEKKMTILLTTHYMEEAELLCDMVGIIDNGKIIALDSVSKLKNDLKGDVIILDVDDSESAVKILKNSKNFDGRVHLSVRNADKKLAQILSKLSKKGVIIKSVNIKKPSLNDVFLSLTGKQIRDEKANDNDWVKNRMRWHGH